MVLPNALIIGPPKTGTTSLWHYLGQHPDVFMSAFKEPAFFWTEAPAWKTNRVTELDEYAALFADGADCRIVGEGSPAYFADPGAPAEIKRVLGDVKLITVLRDPRERILSAHSFQRLREFEPEPNLLDAVEADASRSREERVMYVNQGLYHKHLSRYLSVFPRHQLHVIFNDDMKVDPAAVLKETFEFLGVATDVEIDTTSRLTVSGKPRVRAVHTLLSNRNPLKRAVTPLLPNSVRKVGRKVRDSNLERQTMSSEERRALRHYFERDIIQLQALLHRDLSHWLED